MSFDFLNDEEKAPQQDILHRSLPGWVSETNASLQAFNAINSIKIEKLEYILKNKRSRAFRTKKSYQVKKSKVAKIVEVTPQVLFYLSTYSEELKSFLDKVNDELEEKKTKRLEAKSEGVREKPKAEVYEKYKFYKDALTQLQKNNASDQVTGAISRMSFQTRKKLGL